ncbi:MAG: hypothetical protein ACOZNI_37035 [Myxococcota bacterium]
MLWLMLACTGGEGDDTAVEAPTVAWLTPSEGADTAVGDLACSLVVENFLLESPAKHGAEGETPEGYLAIRLDGADVLETADTQFTVTVDAGEHTLEAELLYADGDPLDPAVTASVGFVALE